MSNTGPLLCWPLEHYYSPVPDHRVLVAEPERSRVWPEIARPTPGIDWRDEEQVKLLTEHLARQPPIELPRTSTGNPHEWHSGPENEMFAWFDGWLLQAMLRHLSPRRMIEVGCGWSSLLTARINREHLSGSLGLTCVEPYPPDFLGDGIEGIDELIVSRIQDLPLDRFLELGDGDVLFIDTSHTVKTGGDVVFLLTEVLPRLNQGVVVHIHDIFLPAEYPEAWVFEGRAWNEQYMLRAFLTFNSAFEILLGAGWLLHRHTPLLASVIPEFTERYVGAGSIWLRRV